MERYIEWLSVLQDPKPVYYIVRLQIRNNSHICIMSKLWQKTTNVNELVENFTVGRDREFDEQMAAFDVLGSLAHTRMLQSIGLMSEADLQLVQKELH